MTFLASWVLVVVPGGVLGSLMFHTGVETQEHTAGPVKQRQFSLLIALPFTTTRILVPETNLSYHV